jgi:homogentisate 1,2-dioxygenase
VLPFRPFDYVVIPRCTTYKLDFEAGTPPDLLVIESAGTVNVPPKYLNHDGQLRLGAPYAERDLHGPTDLFVIDEERYAGGDQGRGAAVAVRAGEPPVRRDRVGRAGVPVHVQRRRLEPITGPSTSRRRST